ncbi:hypothetical protein IHE33_06505 [Mycetohabitans endofungorum]|uniref:hypothetical protein n=1 Tax=Mycetohabitans endofungorum TaxID=417203 RepID=UPI0030D3FB5D
MGHQRYSDRVTRDRGHSQWTLRQVPRASRSSRPCLGLAALTLVCCVAAAVPRAALAGTADRSADTRSAGTVAQAKPAPAAPDPAATQGKRVAPPMQQSGGSADHARHRGAGNHPPSDRKNGLGFDTDKSGLTEQPQPSKLRR